MSRSNYSEDCENIGLWRGAVEQAIRGKRGQALLRDMLAALDALPSKRLITEDLVAPSGECCALGSLALAVRCVDVRGVEPTDQGMVAELFDIAPALAAEIAYENDEAGLVGYIRETPEQRWVRMRAWAARNIK